MNDLYVLPDDLQDEIGKQVLTLFGYVRDYLDMCKTDHVLPQMQYLDMLTSTYVKYGAEEAQSLARQRQVHKTV
jgi:hypothetical protein